MAWPHALAWAVSPVVIYLPTQREKGTNMIQEIWGLHETDYMSIVRSRQQFG